MANAGKTKPQKPAQHGSCGKTCSWPEGTCQSWVKKQLQPDPFGRVWMHCESGLNMSNASLARFMAFCLSNRVELGSVHAFQPNYKRSTVLAAIRLRPDQFGAFEEATGGKLRPPPQVKLNCNEGPPHLNTGE